MIPRYARETMTAIWSPETKYRIWFEIEAHAADAMAELGVIPKDAARVIWEKGRDAKFDPERIDEIEREVKHDVIAFLTHLAEFVGPEARFVHQGMTSSDVLDTTLAVQVSRASDILIADIDWLLAALNRRAIEHKLRPRNTSRQRRRAHRRCPISAIRCCRRIWPGSRAWCGPMSRRRSRTSRFGTSATSRIPRSSAISRPTPPSRWISHSPARPIWSSGLSSIPHACGPISTAPAESSIADACFWPSPRKALRARRPIGWSRKTASRGGKARGEACVL